MLCIDKFPLPDGAILMALIRGDEAIIPAADTVIQEGDKAVLLVKRGKESEVHDLL